MAGESLAVGKNRAISVSPEESTTQQELMPIHTHNDIENDKNMKVEGGGMMRMRHCSTKMMESLWMKA